MSKFTLYRADIDSPRLERVLGKVPGVAVAGEQAGDRRAEGAPVESADDETAAPAAWTESEDDGGLREKIPVPDTGGDEDGTSVVKTYGLLGLGISMVMLGIATVGIWVYRRRKGDDSESETPPPSGLATDEPTPTERSTSESVASATDTETTATSDVSVVQPDEQAADEPADTPEPRGRTEGDRSDVEWATRDTTPTTEPTAGDSDESAPEKAESDDDEPGPTESVDAAPLLGAAFLAVSGAVIKWLQADADEA